MHVCVGLVLSVASVVLLLQQLLRGRKLDLLWLWLVGQAACHLRLHTL